MTMNKKLVIFGVGSFAKLAYVYFANDSPYQVAAFTAHEKNISEPTLFELDVVPYERLNERYPPDDFALFVAVGYRRVNKARAEVYEDCKSRGYELVSYVSSKAWHLGHFDIGDNCFIFESNVIQPFVKIGNNVIAWSGNHIGHEAVIEDHCFITSHAVISGHVRVGQYSFVGVNATIRDGVKIAPECVIGAGAVILRDTKFQGVYAVETTRSAPIASCDLQSFQ